jgi:protein-S-isoprenylcysteine O-methyltransferase Ste14
VNRADASRLARNVPIPEPHVAGLIASAVLERLVPPGGRPIARPAAVPLVACGVALGAWAVAESRKTDIDQPGRLLTAGPYAAVRNPMYVAWTLGYLGVAAGARSRWPLALLPVVLTWLALDVAEEERGLRERFGDEYAAYAARTGRWLPTLPIVSRDAR